MPYLDQSLGKSEVIAAKARLAWIYSAAAWACLLVGAVIAGLLATADLARPFTPAAVAGSMLISIAAFFAILIPVWTTEVGVTNQRLIVKRGVLGRSTEELELWSIEEVDLKQSPLDRLLGLGRLVISGTGDDDMTTPPISNVLDFRKAVQEAINDARPSRLKS